MSIDQRSQHEGTCVYCQKTVGHLNNHIRMSTGDHGPQGQYPGDWDPETWERNPQGSNGTTDGGSDGSDPRADHGGTTVDVDGPDEASQDLADLVVDDHRADAREYECGECGADVPYLQDCEECGEELAWQGVTA